MPGVIGAPPAAGVIGVMGVMGVIDKGADWVNVLRMVGKTPVALLITVLYALWMFRQSQGKVQLEKFCNDALAPVCAVILVTGAGGIEARNRRPYDMRVRRGSRTARTPRSLRVRMSRPSPWSRVRVACGT